MNEENIPKLQGNIQNDIKLGYTGGSTDMFIPYGEKLDCYDVNSLYPSVMIDKDMPIGKITKFEGDITKINVNTFGFFYVKVECPIDIMHPILQIRHKTASGIKTISPVGTWNMWIFSEEMYNAEKYGYKFNILSGYKFNKEVVFKDYVDYLYQLRIQYSKLDPYNLIAKILLNSLYGRFGMKEVNIKYEIISREEFSKIEITLIKDYIEIENNILVGLHQETGDSSINVSIAVAAAITAYSRIHMTKFKNDPNIKLYYSDTDSVFVDKPFDPSLIDSKILGKLKLEYICEEAVFLGPKCYCLKTEKGLITKVKGLKDVSTLDMKDFKSLLFKNNEIIKNHKKWFRSLELGKITIKDQLYSIKSTDNKRHFIYNKDNKIIATKPIILNEE